MRVHVFTLAALSGALLAGSASAGSGGGAWSSPATTLQTTPQPVQTNVSDLSRCGPKPTTIGDWKCVQVRANSGSQMQSGVKDQPQPLVWRWEKSAGTSAMDNWSSHN